MPEIERIGNQTEEGRDRVAERDVADKGAGVGDDERAARRRDRRAPAGKWLDFAQDEIAADNERNPEPCADFGELARWIGPSAEQEDLAPREKRAEREFPGPRPRQIEGADRIDRGQNDAIGERGEKYAEDDERQQPAVHLEHRQQQNRPDEIELLLDAERPEMEQGLGGGIRAEISPDSGEPHKPEVYGEI